MLVAVNQLIASTRVPVGQIMSVMLNKKTGAGLFLLLVEGQKCPDYHHLAVAVFDFELPQQTGLIKLSLEIGYICSDQELVQPV